MTEFIYRYESEAVAHVLMSFMVDPTTREKEISSILSKLDAQGMKGYDLSNDELAKAHARYMTGGRKDVPHERMFRFGLYYTFPSFPFSH